MRLGPEAFCEAVILRLVYQLHAAQPKLLSRVAVSEFQSTLSERCC